MTDPALLPSLTLTPTIFLTCLQAEPAFLIASQQKFLRTKALRTTVLRTTVIMKIENVINLHKILNDIQNIE